MQMKQKIQATGHQFMTCSALCQDGLSRIFDESIRQTLEKRVTTQIKKKEEERFCQLIWFYTIWSWIISPVHVFIMERDNKLLFIASSSCQKGTPSESRPNAGYERCTVYRFSHKLTAKNVSLIYLQLASKYLLFWNPPCWGSTFLSRCQFMWLLPFFWG